MSPYNWVGIENWVARLDWDESGLGVMFVSANLIFVLMLSYTVLAVQILEHLLTHASLKDNIQSGHIQYFIDLTTNLWLEIVPPEKPHPVLLLPTIVDFLSSPEIPIDLVLFGESEQAQQAQAAPASTPAATQRKPQAHWSKSDEKKLMEQALEKFAGSGDGCNFGKPFWKAIATTPFCNDGWVHLNNFRKLIPDAPARGHNIFWPGFQPAVQSQLQSEDDEDWDNHSITWDLENELEKEQEKEKDSDDESEKENEPLKTPAPKRKRPAEDAPSTAKKSRNSLTGVSALHDVAGQITDFNDIFRMAFVPSAVNADIPLTPARLRSAIERAQKLETWMDKSKLVELLEVLEDKKSAVDVYNSLDDEELRIMWVKHKVGIA
ncbi:hypothetical protein B0H17DRAFT_1138164 [Mycena rosella]|uniref:Uncharacterized protein n=1 Tax=Mycena rosella TaxID=1033263 RepID=A0AAD7D885_MYCRO|nr:hypothetical protein B0H17DRAFT_1138164 [Mycena rosella]